jgi:hypothetical protein
LSPPPAVRRPRSAFFRFLEVRWWLRWRRPFGSAGSRSTASKERNQSGPKCCFSSRTRLPKSKSLAHPSSETKIEWQIFDCNRDKLLHLGQLLCCFFDWNSLECLFAVPLLMFRRNATKITKKSLAQDALGRLLNDP